MPDIVRPVSQDTRVSLEVIERKEKKTCLRSRDLNRQLIIHGIIFVTTKGIIVIEVEGVIVIEGVIVHGYIWWFAWQHLPLPPL